MLPVGPDGLNCFQRRERDLDWDRDWAWASEFVSGRMSYLAHLYMDHVESLDQMTLLHLLRMPTHTLILRRFKARCKEVFLRRFIRGHLR
jgi:hypothetical protein